MPIDAAVRPARRECVRPACRFGRGRSPAIQVRFVALAIVGGLLGNAASAETRFLTLGTEIDDEGGYLLVGDLTGDIGDDTTWSVGVSHAESAAELSGLDTTAYDGSIGHDFGRIGVRFGAGAWSEPGTVDTSRLTAAVDFHGSDWQVAIETQFRENDFDPIRVGTTVTRRNGETVSVDAVANCSLEDTGLGVRAGISGERWRIVLNAMSYDYDEARCSFDSPLLQLLSRASRDEFVQIAATLTRAFSIGARTRVLSETSFLDSRLGARLTLHGDRRSYNVAVDRTEDAFFDSEATTLSGGVLLPFRSRNELEVYGGVTDGDELGSIAFFGFMAYLAL